MVTGSGAISSGSATLLDPAAAPWRLRLRRANLAGRGFKSISRQWIVFAVCACGLYLIASWCAERFAIGGTDRALASYASSAATLRATGLQSVLEKDRSLLLVLSDDADIRATLLKSTPEGIERLNRKLDRMSVGAGVSVIYILNRQG